MPAQIRASGTQRYSCSKPVSSVMNDAPKKPKAANRIDGTTIDASRNAQAISQPAYDPSPRPTYVYMPPADGRWRASSPIENAVNRTATNASTTASGVSPNAYVVA